VRLLLDTHAFLWFVADDVRLSTKARRRIEDGRNETFLSIASVWEMAIKIGLGKLRLEDDLGGVLEHGARENRIASLAITKPHAIAVAELPDLHRDPFDRMLVAQARLEEMVLIGRDPVFDGYGIRRIW
jgi:PIN domain nuclease of toxin-antitoxin system